MRGTKFLPKSLQLRTKLEEREKITFIELLPFVNILSLTHLLFFYGKIFYIQQCVHVNPKLPAYLSSIPFPSGNPKSVLKSQLYLHFPLTQHYPIFILFLVINQRVLLPCQPSLHICMDREGKERNAHTCTNLLPIPLLNIHWTCTIESNYSINAELTRLGN